MAVIKWELLTLDLATTYTFAVNPNAMDSFMRQRTIQQTATTGGGVIVTEGSRPVRTATFKGVLISKAQFDAFVAWHEAGHGPCYLDDHLGRRWTVYITDFAPTPRLTRNQWSHDYTISLLVFDAPTYL